VIVYHGLGYVGLTGAVHFARVGATLGYDPDQTVVDAINAGTPKAGEFLAYLSGCKLPRATTNFAEISHHPIHILAVPTEREGQPWMALVKTCVARLLERVPNGALIIIESTLTPGAVDQMIAGPLGQRIATGQVDLAVAPRRDWFADPQKNLASIHRIVGGYTPAATERAVRVLARVTHVDWILPTDCRTAELVKPLENALFHLPIMLGHELAMTFPDLDIVEALRLATTHWRFASLGGLYVGFGSGGRCVNLGPKYLLAAAAARVSDDRLEAPPQLLTQTLAVENAVTDAIVRIVLEEVSQSRAKAVLILGLGYRPNFADMGYSPGIRIARALAGRVPSIDVHVDDSIVPRDAIACELGEDAPFGITSITTQRLEYRDRFLASFDVILLATPHDPYLALPASIAWRAGQLVIDARGAWAHHLPLFQAAGVAYRQVGKPGWRTL